MRIAFKMGETYIRMGHLKKAIRYLKMCLKLSMASQNNNIPDTSFGDLSSI